MTRVLVVEDNTNLRHGICEMLESDGYEILGAADGSSALELTERHHPDLIVLDLMLPGVNGMRVLRALRDRGNNVPILVLTAKPDEDDKVAVLQAGADDYVTKPFGRRELVARVAALLRRASQTAGGDDDEATVTAGDILIDTRRRVVTRAGRVISLALKEFELLLALARRRGTVATRSELLREVWHYEPDVASRTVDLHIMELRRKLQGDIADESLIVTVRKVGYRLGDQAASR